MCGLFKAKCPYCKSNNKAGLEIGAVVYIYIDEAQELGGGYIISAKVQEISNIRFWADDCDWDYKELGKYIFLSLAAAQARYPYATLDLREVATNKDFETFIEKRFLKKK